MDPPTFEKSQDHLSSSKEPAYTAFRTSFASISLHKTDRIRLLQFPQEDITAIRSIVKSSWYLGLQAEKKYSYSYEFKLHGNPWRGSSSDAIPARILMREVFAYLFAVGWILHASTDVSKKEFDKDTLVFRKQQTPPPESEWISISFNRTDRLRLIGDPDGKLREAFRGMLKGMSLLQEEGWKDVGRNAWEFKLNGHPWMAMGEETMSTRLLLLKMVETLERGGWSLYASVDQNEGRGESTSETDSWFCVREKGWLEGSTVFHR